MVVGARDLPKIVMSLLFVCVLSLVLAAWWVIGRVPPADGNDLVCSVLWCYVDSGTIYGFLYRLLIEYRMKQCRVLEFLSHVSIMYRLLAHPVPRL